MQYISLMILSCFNIVSYLSITQSLFSAASVSRAAVSGEFPRCGIIKILYLSYLNRRRIIRVSLRQELLLIVTFGTENEKEFVFFLCGLSFLLLELFNVFN